MSIKQSIMTLEKVRYEIDRLPKKTDLSKYNAKVDAYSTKEREILAPEGYFALNSVVIPPVTTQTWTITMKDGTVIEQEVIVG